MKRGIAAGIGTIIALTIVGVFWWLVQGKQFDVLTPRGEVGAQEKNLLLFALSLCSLIVIPVYLMLIGFAWRYNEKNKKAKYSPNFTNSTLLEGVWWGIPIVIIGILGAVTWQTSHALDPYRRLQSNNKPIEVQVVALQWKWLFFYPDLGIATVNELPIPEKTPIHFQLTANAPMSAFWVPSLGTQIYAMNGMNTQLNLLASTTGNFRGYGTNINGEGYADMTFTVHSMQPEDFKAWQQKTAKTAPEFTHPLLHTIQKPSILSEEKVYSLRDVSMYHHIIEGSMGGM